jgi:HlyD family secretion protein
MKNPSPTLSGMDRKISRPSRKRWLSIAAVAIIVAVAALLLFQQFNAGRSIVVDGQRLGTGIVREAMFEDFIPVRARVAPLKTVYLDAVQGGRVEQLLLDDGAMVAAGQSILRLSNSELQLSVMSTESRVMEQLNAMRDQELRLEQNRLQHKRSLVDVNYELKRLQRDYPRQRELHEQGHVSASNFEAYEDEMHYYKEKRDVLEESQASDAQLMQKQLQFFKEKTAVMEDNLQFARKSLEELNVRAPIGGRLSGFDLEVGQNISKGTRIGQIDLPDQFKLVADIDEYYLGRIDLQQALSVNYRGDDYTLHVNKIYPNVRNGRFQVDFQFEQTPSGIRRGQNLQGKLTLGSSAQALLLPMGSFYSDSGGQWVFVLDAEGKNAVKRPVRLGRRNEDFIEILDGLQEGDEVVISSYAGFTDMDKLTISNNSL